MLVGPCRAHVKRYFYDETSGECVPFTFGGCHGNANNFASKQKCTNFCRDLKSINGIEEPFEVEKSYRYKRCYMQDDSGPCNSRLPRWFFNAKTSDCELFYYGGCQGNRNNFGSKKSCLMKCHPQGLNLYKNKNTVLFPTPAPYPTPDPWDIDDENDNDNSKKVRCYLPMATGHCKAFHRMFYYDAESGRCRPFVYGGCGGNDNRFTKEIDCENTCVEKDESGAFFDPADFPQSDVPSRRVRHVVETCTLPPESGPCRDVIKRFYFDPTSGKCHQFYYGGCKGNENNFKTRRECKKSCKSRHNKSKSPSQNSDTAVGTKPSKDDGVAVVKLEKNAATETLPNSEVEIRFHNDEGSASSSSSSSNTTSIRDPLEYDYRFEKEMEGNIENEAAMENDVIAGDNDDASSIDNNAVVDLDALGGKPAARCLHVPESGSGTQIIRSYFYNVESEKCERFYYSGEGGNENRFESLDECLQACAS